jgi:hypothetical protein
MLFCVPVDGKRLWIAMPNIIDLSGKKKKLWSGQASLRRSRRRGDIINLIILYIKIHM